ncbi:NUDIX domain-containing protein [Burkholderia ambifaria]|nr:NUDIX domain-containing protein [Burkholderia ambifaria]
MSPRSSTPDLKERATIVCRQGQRVLLVARTASRWALPGGTIKSDEFPVDAAHRELREETGLIGLKLTYVFQLGGLTKLHHVFVADVPVHAKPQSGMEITRCRWFGHFEVTSLPTSVPTLQIVELLYNRSRVSAEGVFAGR